MANHDDWPILTAENCFQEIRKSGIVPWVEKENYGPMGNYLNGVSEDELTRRVGQVIRYAPQTIVTCYQSQDGSKKIDGFKTIFTPYAMVFALINDYVPVTVEWKHGNGLITIVPVSGTPHLQEINDSNLPKIMREVAMREWREETGTNLAYCMPVSPDNGLWANVRSTQTQCFLFAGEIKPGDDFSPNLDATEDLKMFRFSLSEWIKLMTTPDLWNQNPDFGLEAVVPTLTFLALRHFGKLSFS